MTHKVDFPRNADSAEHREAACAAVPLCAAPAIDATHVLLDRGHEVVDECARRSGLHFAQQRGFVFERWLAVKSSSAAVAQHAPHFSVLCHPSPIHPVIDLCVVDMSAHIDERQKNASGLLLSAAQLKVSRKGPSQLVKLFSKERYANVEKITTLNAAGPTRAAAERRARLLPFEADVLRDTALDAQGTLQSLGGVVFPGVSDDELDAVTTYPRSVLRKAVVGHAARAVLCGAAVGATCHVALEASTWALALYQKRQGERARARLRPPEPPKSLRKRIHELSTRCMQLVQRVGETAARAGCAVLLQLIVERVFPRGFAAGVASRVCTMIVMHWSRQHTADALRFEQLSRLFARAALGHALSTVVRSALFSVREARALGLRDAGMRHSVLLDTVADTVLHRAEAEDALPALARTHTGRSAMAAILSVCCDIGVDSLCSRTLVHRPAAAGVVLGWALLRL